MKISDDKTVLPSTDYSEDKTFITSENPQLVNVGLVFFNILSIFFFLFRFLLPHAWLHAFI